MTKTKQDEVQDKIVEDYLNSDGNGILYVTMRTGKCRIGIKIFEELGFKNILIVYPKDHIKKSWIDELLILEKTDNFNITFSTYLSLHKHLNTNFEVIVFDEVDQTSDVQRENMKILIDGGTPIIGLTGTLTADDRGALQELGLKVLSKYTRKEAIKDAIIADYKIGIIETPLDTTQLIYSTSKGKKLTEKKKFDMYSWVIEKQIEEEKNPFYMRLNRMRVIYNSIAKINKCKQMLSKLENNKVLVFTGSKNVAESLGIDFYHSTSKDKDVLNRFLNGEIKHLAVCKMLDAGVTIPGLEYVIIQSFDSNSSNLEQKIGRCVKLEFKTKIAKIYIITTTEDVEKKWLKKALINYDKNKIITP